MSTLTASTYAAAVETFVAVREALYLAAVAHVRDEVLARYPDATHIDVQSSDQDTYGWTLYAVMRDDIVLNDADENETDFDDLDEEVSSALSDLPWENGPVETDGDSDSTGSLAMQP